MNGTEIDHDYVNPASDNSTLEIKARIKDQTVEDMYPEIMKWIREVLKF